MDPTIVTTLAKVLQLPMRPQPYLAKIICYGLKLWGPYPVGRTFWRDSLWQGLTRFNRGGRPLAGLRDGQ